MSTHATVDLTLLLGVCPQCIKRRRSAIMPRCRQLQNPSLLALQLRLTREFFSPLRWASRLRLICSPHWTSQRAPPSLFCTRCP